MVLCTLSIFPATATSLMIVTMNRDESRDRHEAPKPYIQAAAGQQAGYCHGVDARAGGTWFAMNSASMAFALLNRYQDPQSDNKASRGAIIPALAVCNSPQQVQQRLDEMDLSHYNPFDLVIAHPEGHIHLSWTGQHSQLTHPNGDQPFFISSSMVRTEYVLGIRRDIFERFVATDISDPDIILSRLHLNLIPEDTCSSILMSRRLSHTKSLCQAQLGPDGLWRYYQASLVDQLRNGHAFEQINQEVVTIHVTDLA